MKRSSLGMPSPQKIKIFFALTGGMLVILFAWFVFWAPNTLSSPTVIFTVNKGDGLSEVASSLKNAGIISNTLFFKIAGKVLGLSGKIRAGQFKLPDGISNKGILEAITEGEFVFTPEVTIPEGLRITAIARILKKEIGIDSARFVELCKDTSLLKIPGQTIPSLEGFLLPETYQFEWQADEKIVLERFLSEFREFFCDSLQGRLRVLNLSLKDVVTMASIVEAETRIDTERPIVAGVYYNRMKKKMRLEADPTVQYALKSGRRLRFSDLKMDSPYNTYRRYGLPPGPINNPGRGSLLASLYPALHRYLFFVADGHGGHKFSQTYDQHLVYVREYRKNRATVKKQSVQ